MQDSSAPSQHRSTLEKQHQQELCDNALSASDPSHQHDPQNETLLNSGASASAAAAAASSVQLKPLLLLAANGRALHSPPPPPPPQSSTSNNNVSSERFQTSSLTEAEQVVHVYSLLERLGGVYGDGHVEGVELTRDGRALSYQTSEQGRQQWDHRLRCARYGDPKHVQALASTPHHHQPEVDRYGFFTQLHALRSSTASNDARTWLLEKAAFESREEANTTTPGTTSSAAATPKRASLATTRPPTLQQVQKETERMNKWQKMLAHVGPAGQERAWCFTPDTLNSARRRRKLRRRIYKGVPDRWRPAVWPLLASLTPTFGSMPESVLLKDGDLGRGKRLSRADMQTATEHDTQIDLDIPRTLGTHTLFVTRYGKGQRMLFEVLHERSGACRECGYCQGMATIAGMCIAYGSPSLVGTIHGPDTKSSGDANGGSVPAAEFPPFDRIGKFRHHDMLRTGFPALQDCFDQQERLCQAWMPQVAAALDKHGIHPSSYATKWYITLFTSSTFSFEMQLRIWDAFLLEGREVLIVVSLAIIWGLRGVILSPKADFETILNALSGAFVVEDQDGFMKWVQDKIKSWRKSATRG